MSVKYPEDTEKIGKFVYLMSRIDIELVTALTMYLTHGYENNSQRVFLVNDLLMNNSLLDKIENKRALLVKIVKVTERVAKEINANFESSKYLLFLEEIKKLQESRNKILHAILSFRGEGLVCYSVRKTDKERFADKKGSVKDVCINLNDLVSRAELVASKNLPTEMVRDALRLDIGTGYMKGIGFINTIVN